MMKVTELKPLVADLVDGGWEVGEMFPVGCSYGISDKGDIVVYWPSADLWDDELGDYCSLTVTLADGGCLGYSLPCDGSLESVNAALALGSETEGGPWGDLGI